MNLKTQARARDQAGFSLIEVMAAVMLLAISMTLMLGIRNQAIDRSAEARSLSVATRLARGLMNEIEAARIQELFDGYTGDFTERGYPDFAYLIGLGDGSLYSGAATGSDEREAAWRRVAEDEYDEMEDDEESDRPEKTRVFVTVLYPGSDGEEKGYTLETLLPSWAVYQDFEAYEDKWGDNYPEEIE